ncbi:hypothetical protein [Leptospira dzoumogneensis]|uniref:Uncharacterized protein n=1 Tax=Leptospira dzoumogneensis TaxID=2484904 RepID=A0A4Z1AEE5_9LEPT|nr:hypothetical protein [Leptospira dzoumogneensis]TGN00017.1 hypothetical protein EHR06_07810 [Leptospira dzoumogneensis]
MSTTQYFYIDPKVFLNLPGLFASKRSGVQLVFNEPAYGYVRYLELEGYIPSGFSNFIQKSIQDRIIIYTDDILNLRPYSDSEYIQFFPLSIAKSKSNYPGITLVTDDSIFNDHLPLYNIKTIGSKEFSKKFLDNEIEGPRNNEKESIDLSRKKSIGSKLTFLYGLLVGIFFGFSMFIYHWIILNVNRIVLILCALLLSYLMFVLRDRKRRAYGVAEVVVGFSTILTSFQSISDINASTSSVLSALAGIYVIIRGLDNIDGTMKYSSLNSFWNCFFFRKKKVQE